MEAILGPDDMAFETFISKLTSSSSEAESMFNMIKHKDPNLLALKLANLVESSSCATFATTLLQNLFAGDNDLCTWRNISLSTRSTVKEILLNRIKLEESKSIIKSLCQLLYVMLGLIIHETNNELGIEASSFFSQCDSFTLNKLAEPSLLIIAEVAQQQDGTSIPSGFKNLYPQVLATLKYSTDMGVRMAALRAAIDVVQSLPSSKDKERYHNLLPAVLGTLTDALSNGEEVAAREALDHFIKFAENDPRFLKSQLVDVVNSMFEIAEAENLENKTRHLAIEFLITLVEAKEKAPGMMKKLPLFTSNCFALLLNLLLDVEDEPPWNTIEKVEFREGSNILVGIRYFDRLSRALGGKTIAPVAKEQLFTFLAAPEWEKRHAALLALAVISECCPKVMVKSMEELVLNSSLVKMVLNCFQDSNPRVRWGAVRAISQLSVDFSPQLQERFHDQVLPALAAAMADFQNPLIQVCTSTAFYSFCGSCMPETLIPFFDGIIDNLPLFQQSEKEMVRDAALTLFISTHKLPKEYCRIIYDTIMPYLKTALENINCNLLGRARAMYSISYLGIAVGNEKFRDDAKQVMEVLVSLLGSDLKADDRSIIYLIGSGADICKCMGKEFLSYMRVLILFMIQLAQVEVDMTDYDDSYSGLYGLDYDMDIIVKLEENIMCVKQNVQLEEKSTACHYIGFCARILREDFYPWISQASSALVPLLEFDIRDEVREDAIRAMKDLLISSKLAVAKGIAESGDVSHFKQLSDSIILALGKALHSDPGAKVCSTILDELNKCLQICRQLLNKDQVRNIVDAIKLVISESSDRKQELKEREATEDFDAEESELGREEKELEDEVFINVGGVLRTLIRIFKATFLPFFDELSPYLMPMWGKDKSTKERSTSIHLFNDLVEYCNEAALKCYNIYLPLLLDASNDESPKTRQAALHGIGLCAAYAGLDFKPFAGEALSRINLVITHLNALQPENKYAYDNAVSALGKICQFHRESIDATKSKMSSGKLLNIEPLELKFPFLLKRHISCLFHLSNKTENHIAFKVMLMNPEKYWVGRNKGIVLARSTCYVRVTMKAQAEAPSDMHCKDKFLVQSVVANPGITSEDITNEMFNKEAGCVVDECKLRVSYLPQPQPPSPVAEGSEESSPRQSINDNGLQDGSEVIPIWLNCLPVKDDLNEAKYVHGELCSMVERLDRELIGPNYQNLPKIISVFAEVLCSEKVLATKVTENRMINVLRHLHQTLPLATFESAWSYLLPQQEMELKSLLSPEEDAKF